MRAEKLNNRITIQLRTVDIIKGIKQEIWNDYYICYAELLDLYGQEKYSAYSVQLENSIKFKCRMCNLLKNMINNKDYKATVDFRIIFNDIPYDIVHIDTINGSKTEIVFQVNRVN